MKIYIGLIKNSSSSQQRARRTAPSHLIDVATCRSDYNLELYASCPVEFYLSKGVETMTRTKIGSTKYHQNCAKKKVVQFNSF